MMMIGVGEGRKVGIEWKEDRSMRENGRRVCVSVYMCDPICIKSQYTIGVGCNEFRCLFGCKWLRRIERVRHGDWGCEQRPTSNRTTRIESTRAQTCE